MTRLPSYEESALIKDDRALDGLRAHRGVTGACSELESVVDGVISAWGGCYVIRAEVRLDVQPGAQCLVLRLEGLDPSGKPEILQ